MLTVTLLWSSLKECMRTTMLVPGCDGRGISTWCEHKPLQANAMDRAGSLFIEVIKVPEGAVVRGCKKTRRKLRAHLQLRAEIHSQLRVIASLFVLNLPNVPGYRSAIQPPAVQPPQAPDAPPLPPLPPRAPAQPAPAQPASMECDIDSDSEPDCGSEPEPQFDSGSESEPEPVTQSPQRQRRHPMLMPIFEDPNNQALLAKLQDLGNINLRGDANTIGAHSMQLAVAMQQHYSNPGKALCQAERQGSQGPGRLEWRGGAAWLGWLNKLSATRPAGWKPPAGQAEQRLLRPAWSQQCDQPVRGLMWCPVVAPRKPPQAPGGSQEASQPAASEPGPGTPPPAQRTRAEPAAEPTKSQGKAKGKAVKAKPAPQPGRWLDRDCNAALNMQRIGESRWRPLELCYWPEQGALPTKGKEYLGLGYKRLRDKPPMASSSLLRHSSVCPPFLSCYQLTLAHVLSCQLYTIALTGQAIM
ncbi:hypothetical protein QJQ45_029184 [Haematococcus lacustris]|nr:hypothetical protein QJQ45_029184 [Haematococcus lacustris]